MSRPSLILVGGGGHCRSVIDVIGAEGRWDIAGILDRQEMVGRSVLGHAIIGTDTMIPTLVDKDHAFIITAGQVKDASLRIKLFTLVQQAGGKLATVVSPLAHVAASAQVGEGSVIGHFALLNSGARTGSNCIVNSGAIVEHDTSIGDHSHIATGAIVNGGCTVGEGSFIGSRAVLLQAVHVGKDCVVGAGSVVLKDVGPGITVFGQPARER